MPTYDQWKVSFFFFLVFKVIHSFQIRSESDGFKWKIKAKITKAWRSYTNSYLSISKLQTQNFTVDKTFHSTYILFFKIKLCHSFWFTVKFAAWTFNSKLVGATIIYHVRDGSRTATVPWPRANNFWIIMKKIIKIGRKWKKKNQ